MKRMVTLAVMAGLAVASPAAAQLGGLSNAIKKGQQAKDTVDSLTISDAEEKQIGSDISAKLRDKYGVVQDKAVTKYVTLVGTVLAQQSSRPNLDWTFIVLDTDGVNAFAAGKNADATKYLKFARDANPAAYADKVDALLKRMEPKAP